MSDYLKELSSEFSENLKLNYDLKKKIGLILVAKQRFIIKRKI
jgi:hypothetical protein